MDNIKEWTSLPMPELLTKPSCIKDWKRISAESSLMSPRQPNRSRDRTELKIGATLCKPAKQETCKHETLRQDYFDVHIYHYADYIVLLHSTQPVAKVIMAR